MKFTLPYFTLICEYFYNWQKVNFFYLSSEAFDLRCPATGSIVRLGFTCSILFNNFKHILRVVAPPRSTYMTYFPSYYSYARMNPFNCHSLLLCTSIEGSTPHWCILPVITQFYTQARLTTIEHQIYFLSVSAFFI